jgi:DNA-binding LytR/AlgR family response regulator
LETIHEALQQFDPGMVWLDNDNRILAMNGIAIEMLNARPGELIDEDILAMHPQAGREQVKSLLAQSAYPAESPPPMTMMINVPERMLLVKVSKMNGVDGMAGACMVFYDLTDLATRHAEATASDAADVPRRRLYKLPVQKDKRVLLVDLESVCCIKADGRYSTLYTDNEDYFCSLSISELDRRLDARFFFRVHRSHLVNLRFAKSFEKVDDQCFIVMDHKEGIKVPISRNKVNELKEMLGLT